jgi:hypothetical protein
MRYISFASLLAFASEYYFRSGSDKHQAGYCTKSRLLYLVRNQLTVTVFGAKNEPRKKR